MPNNMILLETIALTQSAASVTFDNLPTSGYTDLKIVFSIRTDNNSSNYLSAFVTFNGSSTGYSQRMLYGTGSSALSASGSGSYLDWLAYGTATPATASTFGNGEMYIPNYRGSTNKSVSSDSVSENNATNAITALTAGLWSNNAAITSITFTGNSGNFAANSTFSLYGVAALGTTPVLAPKASGGNIVANDGTYWYHAFTSSGNFVPQVGLTADVLVVAGGGGTSSNFPGGGGAGGLLAHTSQSLANGTNYACTIGAGGAGRTDPTRGSNGVNSQFASLTASVGGGGGGARNGTKNGADGGSGGGGAFFDSVGGAGTSGQGNSGGAQTSPSGPNYGTGGGGGAGAAGTAGNASTTGDGGNGSSAYSSWGIATNTGQNVSGTRWYAGGGSGVGDTDPGAGGLGGGAIGTGGGNNGTANTGGGAGGDTKSGGSGIILIRYPI